MKRVLINCIFLLFGFFVMIFGAITPQADKKFNATADAIDFRHVSSMESLAQQIFLERSHSQRILIQLEYNRIYKEEMFPKPSGFCYTLFGDEYADLLHTMSRPIERQYALDMIEDNKPGIGAPNALIDAMATLNNKQWRLVRDFASSHEEGSQPLYIDYFKNDLEHFEKMIETISNGERNESQIIDVVTAKRDANLLYNNIGSRENMRGDNLYNEHRIREIFSLRSFGHINEICKQYRALYRRRLLGDIENYQFIDEFVKKAILAIIRVQTEAPTYFAERLYNSLNGPGTSERDLNRIIITRSNIDMEEIRNAFKMKYEKSLSYMIVDDTSGKYQNMLLAIID